MSKLPSLRHPVACWLGLSAALAAQTPWTPATREAVPEILSSGFVPGGFRIEIAAPPGDFRLERSTTLLQNSWQNLGAIDPIFGIGVRTDVGALSLPKAFYRVAGSFDEIAMKLVAFDSTLSSVKFTDTETPITGGLWTQQSLENLNFQSAEPATGLVKLLGGTSGGFLVEPYLDSPIFTWVEKFDENETLPVTIDDEILTIQSAEGPVEFFPLEPGIGSYIGLAQQFDAFVEGNLSFSERSQETVWIISKSQNAQPSDLAGNWGFVRILSDGFETEGFLDGYVFPTSITSGPNPRTFTVNNAEGFEIEHAWSQVPVGVNSVFYTDNPGDVVSLNLASNGEVTLNVPGDNAFKGIVSPSAKLLVATASDPDITSDPNNEGQSFGEVQWLVGVKRTNTPALAGKTYRVIRQGWWVDGDYFEVDRSDATDELVFNFNGTSVSRTSAFIYNAVSFGGVFENDSDPAELDMGVSVNAQGRIQMEDSVVGEYTVRTRGFAQEGSGLLVLVDCIENADGSAGLGLMIAVQQP